LGVTTIHVTHDQQEALALSDRIAVMNAGDLVQVGPPVDLYERPAADFVASFLGDVNFLDGATTAWTAGLASVAVHPSLVVTVATHAAIASGKRVRLAIRPERLQMGARASGENVWNAVIRDVVFHGELIRYMVEGPGGVRI